MAECRWRLKRCRPLQRTFDGQMLPPTADAAGRTREPDSHQRMHTGMDVTVHQERIDRLLCRARAKLLELQKLRRQGLIEGAVALPPGCYQDAAGDVVRVEVRQEVVTTDSADGQNGQNQERTGTVLPPSVPAIPAQMPEVPIPKATGRYLLGGFGRRRVWAEPGINEHPVSDPRAALAPASPRFQ
jgi:hypothetical protein